MTVRHTQRMCRVGMGARVRHLKMVDSRLNVQFDYLRPSALR
jgi:hypothetical protein